MKGEEERASGLEENLRERVFARDDYRCVYCGEHFPGELLTLDHVEPRMRGGDRSEGNLVASCSACNRMKGASPAWAFLADRPIERENFLMYGKGVWPRLRRAIEEAAARSADRTRK